MKHSFEILATITNANVTYEIGTKLNPKKMHLVALKVLERQFDICWFRKWNCTEE